MMSTVEKPDKGPDPIMGLDPTMGPPKKKMYSCNYCPLDYMARNDCRTHVRKIHNKMTYICELCPGLFYVEKELLDHTRSVHKGKKRNFCSQCPRSYKTRVGLAHHFNCKHKIEKAVECNQCGKEFHNNYSFRKHLQMQHKPKHVYHKCNKCYRSFKHYYLLNQHMKFDHTKNGHWELLNYIKNLNVDKTLISDASQCISCKIKFKCSIDLIEHLKFNHANKVKKFSCCQCKEAVYVSRAALGIHMRYDHGMLNHSCSKCPPAQTRSNTAPLKKKKPNLKSKQNKGSTVRKLNKNARLKVNDGSLLHLFNININTPTIKLNEKVTKIKAPWADKFIKENLPSDMELDNATNQQLENLSHNIRTAFHTLSTVPPSKLKSSMVSSFLNNISTQDIMQKDLGVLSIMFPSMTPSVQITTISDIQPSVISESGSEKALSPLKSSDTPNVASRNSNNEKSFNKHLKNNTALNTLLQPIVSITDILKHVEPNITPNVAKEKKRKLVIEDEIEIDRTVHSNEQISKSVNEFEVRVTTDIPKQIAIPFRNRKLNNIEMAPLGLNTKKKLKTDKETIEPSKLFECKTPIQQYRIPKIHVTDFKKDKSYINPEKHNRMSGAIKSIFPTNMQQAVIGTETFNNTSIKDLDTGVENTQTETISEDALVVSQECYTSSEIYMSPKLGKVKSRAPGTIKKGRKAPKKGKLKHINYGVLHKQTTAGDLNTDIENTQSKITSNDVPLVLPTGETTNETHFMSLKSGTVKENLLTTVCGKKTLKAPRKDENYKYIRPDTLKKQLEIISADVEQNSQKCQITNKTPTQFTSLFGKEKPAVTAESKKAFEPPRKQKQGKDISTLNAQMTLQDFVPTSQECHNTNEAHTQFTSTYVKEKPPVTAHGTKAFETPRKDKQGKDINTLNTQVKIILEDVSTSQESQNTNETHTQFTLPSVKENSTVTSDCKKALGTSTTDKQGKDVNTLSTQVKINLEDLVPASQKFQNINDTHTQFTSTSVKEKSAVSSDWKKAFETPRKDNQRKDINNLDRPVKIILENVLPTSQECVNTNETHTLFTSPPLEEKSAVTCGTKKSHETQRKGNLNKDINTLNMQVKAISEAVAPSSQECQIKKDIHTLLTARSVNEKSADACDQKTPSKTLKKEKHGKQNRDLSSKIKKKRFSTPKIKLSSKLDLSESKFKIALDKVSSTSNIREKTLSEMKIDKNELEKDLSRSLLKSSKKYIEKSKHRHATKDRELSLSKERSHSSQKSLEPTVSSCSLNEAYKIKPPNEKFNLKSLSDNLMKVDNTSQATTTEKAIVSKEIIYDIYDATQKSTKVKHKDDKEMKIEPSQENLITDSSVSSFLLLEKPQDKTTDSLSDEEKQNISSKTKSSKPQKCDDNKKETHISQSNMNAKSISAHCLQNKKETAAKTNSTIKPASVEEQLLVLFKDAILSPKWKKSNYANSNPLDKSPQSNENVLQNITVTTNALHSSSTKKSHTKNKEKAKPTSAEISVSFGVTSKPTSALTLQDNEKQNTDDKISISRDNTIIIETLPKIKQTSDDKKIVLVPKSPSKLDNNMNDSCNSETLSRKRVSEVTQETSLSQQSPTTMEQVNLHVQESLVSKEQAKNLLEKHTSLGKKIPVETKVVSPIKKLIVIPTANKVITPDASITPLHTIEGAKTMYSPINKDYCTNITNRILITNDILIKPSQSAQKVPLKKVMFSPTPKIQTGSVNTTNTITDEQGSTGVENTISILKKPTPAVISAIEPKVGKIHTNARRDSPKKSKLPRKSSKPDNRKGTDLILHENLLTSPSKKPKNENFEKMTKNKNNETVSKGTNDRCTKDLKIILHRCDAIISGKRKKDTTETHKSIDLSNENENKQLSTRSPGQFNYEQGIPDDDYYLSVDSTFCLLEPQFAEVEYDETGLNLLEVANYVDVETTSSPIHSNTVSPVPMIASPLKAYMCASCSMKFIDEISLLNHLTEEHAYNNENLDAQAQSSKTLYKCGTCGSGFRHKDILYKHVKEQHTDTTAYNCKQCSAVFLYKYNLKKHMRKVHATMINTICEICKMEFTSLNALKEHHCCASSDDQDVLVDVVTVDEETKEKLPTHEEILLAHDEILPRHEEILPRHGEIFSAYDKMNLLTEVVNDEVPLNDHKSPAKKLVSFSDIISDQIVQHKLPPVHKISKKSKKHRCEVCNSNLPSGLSLFNHTRLHHKHTILKCNMCKLEFLNPVNFKQHVCKSETRFECKKCKLLFPSKDLLLEHRREKHNLGALKCDYCSKYLKSNQNLIKHITLRHMDRYDYTNVMNLPNKRIKKSRNTKQFSSDIYDDLKIINEASENNCITNEDESLSSNKMYSQKLHKCDICKRKFSFEKDLISHTKLKHKQRRYYKCLKCSRKFSQKILLLKHIKYAHNIEPNKLHRCTECSAVFKFEDKLLQHHKLKHNKTENTEKTKSALNINRKRRVMSKPMRYVAPNASPIRAPNSSPIRAPNASPIRAPNASPIRAPNASPIRAPNASPIRAHNTSPKRASNASSIRAPNASPIRAHNTSPKRAPNASPIRAPNASPIRAPIASPKRGPTVTSIGAPSSEISMGKMYRCNECSATLPTSESLQRHMQWEHMKGHKCGICGELLATAEEFLRHLMFGHGNEKINEVLPTPPALPESSFKWKTHLAYKHERQAE